MKVIIKNNVLIVTCFNQNEANQVSDYLLEHSEEFKLLHQKGYKNK